MKWIFILFIFIFLIFIAGGIFFIVWIIKLATKPKSAQFVQNEQKAMQDKVLKKKSDLTPWQGHTYMDITSAMMYTYVKGFSNKLKGKIFSPNRNAIVVFDRVERGMAANGYMYASSTDFDIFYEINVDQFKIKFNDELLGEIRKSGDIIVNGAKIGNAKHPPKASFSVSFVRFRSGDNKFPLHMNGRHLATIWVAPNYSDHSHVSMQFIFNENNYGQPILEMHDKPTPEEEKWLLSLAILETAFHGHWLI
ncbi:MAG: hypothetical protein AAF193_07795 [Bacteroidota bacterium]